MNTKHYYVLLDGNRIEVPRPVAWEYANHLDKRIKQIDMKTKKYKVAIPKGMKVKRELWPTTNSAKVVVEFEPIEKELPKTWEEYCKNNGNVSWWLTPNADYTGIPEEHKALGKLIRLRDHYNDGWVPDWNNEETKQTIRVYQGKVTRDFFSNAYSSLLCFKDDKLRDKFLSNFAELIETAKILL